MSCDRQVALNFKPIPMTLNRGFHFWVARISWPQSSSGHSRRQKDVSIDNNEGLCKYVVVWVSTTTWCTTERETHLCQFPGGLDEVQIIFHHAGHKKENTRSFWEPILSWCCSRPLNILSSVLPESRQNNFLVVLFIRSTLKHRQHGCCYLGVFGSINVSDFIWYQFK